MTQAHDYAARDQAAPMAMVVLLKLKEPRDLSMRYYRDVHGTLGARACGLHHQYFQHHLDPSTGHEWWRKLPGVDFACAPDEQVDVIAEPTFASPEMVERYGQSEVNGLLYADERYFVERSIGYRTTPGNSRTLVDRIQDGAYSGEQPFHKLILCLAKRPEVEPAAFRSFVRDRLAPMLADAPEPLKVRFHLPEPYDPEIWDPPFVDHARTQAQQHHAFLELGFADALALSRLLSSEAYEASVDEQVRHIGRMHVFRERATYTLGYNGAATLDGVRSPSVAATIRAIGASARAEPPDRRLFYHGMMDDLAAEAGTSPSGRGASGSPSTPPTSSRRPAMDSTPTSASAAQPEARVSPSAVSGSTLESFRRLIDAAYAAFSAMDMDRASRFYAPESFHFDVFPPNEGFDGFERWHREGVEPYVFGPAKRVQFNAHDDLKVWVRGGIAWSTLTFDIPVERKDGATISFDGRQTNVFDRRGEQWLITHEHASMPMGPDARSAPARADRRQHAGGDPTVAARALEWFEGWSSLDPDKVAHLYAKDEDLVFFNLFPPLEGYTGWDALAAGQRKSFDRFARAEFKPNDDIQVRARDGAAWTTNTFHVTAWGKDGSVFETDAHVTLIWEDRDGTWLLVHEHLAASLQM